MDLQLAEKYISAHNNPITKKAELFGSKLFLASLSEEQAQRKERFFEDVGNCLRHERVDRRVARCVAEWLPEQNMAKVTKFTGALHNFGTQNKHGKFLSAEEALFLLEINKLELIYKKVPMSIEEAYKNVRCLKKYLAYRHLVMHGCKLKTPNLNGEVSAKSSSQKEEKIEEPPAKVAKISERVDRVTQILAKLRETAPRSFKASDCCNKVDYCVNMPNSGEKLEPSNLIISTNEEYSTNVDDENSKFFALVSNGDVSFYKFYNTNIPIC